MRSQRVAKNFAMLSAVVLLGTPFVARADVISISLTTDVTGAAGSIITAFGNLSNNTTSTQYFGNDAISLTAPSNVATASDDVILNGLLGSAPTSIAPGATLNGVDLFSVQLLGGSGTFTGDSFQLFGGIDGTGCANGASDCTTLLGTATFPLTVTPVPLPAALWLMLSGLGGMGAMARKIGRRIARGDRD